MIDDVRSESVDCNSGMTGLQRRAASNKGDSSIAGEVVDVDDIRRELRVTEITESRLKLVMIIQRGAARGDRWVILLGAMWGAPSTADDKARRRRRRLAKAAIMAAAAGLLFAGGAFAGPGTQIDTIAVIKLLLELLA